MFLGDALVGVAAMIYSLHVVRLSYHAPRFQPLVLARTKEAVRLCYSATVLTGAVLLLPSQADGLQAFAASFMNDFTDAVTAVGIVIWTGLVTTAFPTWAQSYGQSSVSAGTAQVVYSLQPLWSSLFAFLLLGETFSQQGIAGAVLILSAVLLAAYGTDEDGTEIDESSVAK